MAERKTFLLRVSRDLWNEIERMAADEFRSVNAQVEYLLREALARRGRVPRDQEASSPGREEPAEANEN